MDLPDSFIVKATGRFYTHERVASQMVQAAIAAWTNQPKPQKHALRIIDPFAGDGRLVSEFIKQWSKQGLPNVRWEVELWDLNPSGLKIGEEALLNLSGSHLVDLTCTLRAGDAFHLAAECNGFFDIVVSNPPWELLKPDTRDLRNLKPALSDTYVDAMRSYDNFLAEAYPLAQPRKKFAGWGTNLSRVGFDLCRKLLSEESILAVVMPASFLADDLSATLRQDMFEKSIVHQIAYYPAEAKLFGSADVAAVTIVLEPGAPKEVSTTLVHRNKDLSVVSENRLSLKSSHLKSSGFVIPVAVGGDAFSVHQRLLDSFPTWADLEGKDSSELWAGRELDETGSRAWLCDEGDGPLFAKGRMVNRFRISEEPAKRVQKPRWNAPSSANETRLVWRDVSRPSQKRRVVATLVPPGVVCGNSLGVAYFRNGNTATLKTLLGVMSSLVFEFQLRSYLATSHVSLSSLRKVCVPDRRTLENLPDIRKELEKMLKDPERSSARLEAMVAQQAYMLNAGEFEAILRSFQKLDTEEREKIMEQFIKINRDHPTGELRKNNEVETTPRHIPNHLSARLSELDMRMVRSVPPGGNWKDIPHSIPSRRLEQIRESFKRGEGSRSTYYGRLRPEMPSYTVSTYFNRPGNGCHIHYNQDRVLSQREAARLQSFPDSFAFSGPQGVVNKQIGNAVPPLLAYQIARELGTPGVFVDLFCGAGGMGLGFKWAGWKPIVSNDIEARFLDTYSKNIHHETVLGSISDFSIQRRIVDIAMAARKANPGIPLWVLGGPPCQGFSTAGQRRTMDDERNHLFWDYTRILEQLKPDGFVFENVTGLLNMQGGKVFEVVRAAFSAVMPKVEGWLLSADEHAIPQRRKRVFLVGTNSPNQSIAKPPKLTSSNANNELFSENLPAVSVLEALGDLPPLLPGQDGSNLTYQAPPRTPYQALMRGMISPEEYLENIGQGIFSI